MKSLKQYYKFNKFLLRREWMVMVEGKNVLKFSVSSLMRIIIVITIFLILISLATNIYYYLYDDLAYVNALFSLDKEGNIPTTFSSGLLITASFLFFIIYRVKKTMGELYILNWFILFIIFFLMGLDETIQ
ncbi:MAG: hypothetical protein EHM47_17360, partial [Ignavibacteriales bacterium]